MKKLLSLAFAAFLAASNFAVAEDVGQSSSSGGAIAASLAIIDNLTQTVSATFTPAATSHTAGDAVGAATSFASLGPSGTTVLIASASLEIDNTAAPATAWRLYLYNVTPPSAIADDAAWDIPSGDRTALACFIDLPSTATDQGSTQYVRVEGANVACKLSGTGLFGYLVNLTTASLTASAHIVTISAVPF